MLEKGQLVYTGCTQKVPNSQSSDAMLFYAQILTNT